ncbi:TPA: hypothetical protein ACH3X2_011022 [Trebouxia sp. C0005]
MEATVPGKNVRKSAQAQPADSIRDYMREAAPLGAALTSNSVEEVTPEEEEEEEEEGEDEEEGSDGQDDEQDDSDEEDDAIEVSV